MRKRAMKKRTVITTETREVWVIQRPQDSSQEGDHEAVRIQEDAQGDNRSLAVPTEQSQPGDAPLENE